MTSNSAAPEPMDVPHAELSADALRGVIESFVLREGTDYGASEYSLDEKVVHVMRQLAAWRGSHPLLPATATIDIVVATAQPQDRR